MLTGEAKSKDMLILCQVSISPLKGDDKMNCVYEIVNKINDKRYIGVTKNFNRRWSEHKYDARNDRGWELHKDIKKFGESNFTMLKIHECEDREYAYYLEEFFIKYYNTQNPDLGYNVSLGLKRNKNTILPAITKHSQRKVLKAIDIKTNEEIFFFSVSDAARWLIDNNKCRTKNVRSIVSTIGLALERNKPYYKYQWKEMDKDASTIKSTLF